MKSLLLALILTAAAHAQSGVTQRVFFPCDPSPDYAGVIIETCTGEVVVARTVELRQPCVGYLDINVPVFLLPCVLRVVTVTAAGMPTSHREYGIGCVL